MKKINVIKSKKFVIYKKDFNTDKNDKNAFKLYHKVRDHRHYAGKYRGAAHSICNLRYKTPEEIPVVFHNGSTYDYHFTIKQLAIWWSIWILREKSRKIYNFFSTN